MLILPALWHSSFHNGRSLNPNCTPTELCRPLLRHQRNRRTYNFTGLGIEFLHYPSMISIGVRIRQRPPVQLFQPLSHLNSVLFTSIADFTIWTVESQQGQQVASQIHDKPRGIQFIRLRTCCASSGGNCFSKRRDVLWHNMAHGQGVVSIKLG